MSGGGGTSKSVRERNRGGEKEWVPVLRYIMYVTAVNAGYTAVWVCQLSVLLFKNVRQLGLLKFSTKNQRKLNEIFPQVI